MKDKICGICHTVIDLDKEFCKFEHYQDKDNIKSKAWYHVNCFAERLRGTRVQEAVANKAMEVLDKIGMKVS